MPIKVRSIFITPLFYAPSFQLISSAAELSNSQLWNLFTTLCMLHSTLNGGEGSKRKVGTRRKKGVSVANRLKAKVASEI